jgi:GDP-4-dehydro-6-deoxy-D-mannose reductase
MMDVIVTGGSGFIGQHLVNRLEHDGIQVISLGRKDGDIAKKKTWEQLPPVRSVIHLAGRSYVPDSWEYAGDFIETNIVGTQRALDYCQQSGATIVYATAYPYGVPEKLPITEDAPLKPNNPYSISKNMGEQLCEFSSNYNGVIATVLRLFNVYGRNQRKEFLIPSVIDQALNKSEIRVMDLKPRRDYVYIDDVVRALVKSIYLVKGFNSINIGSGTSYSVGEIIDIIQSEVGNDLKVISTNSERINEIPDVIADISRAQRILDWEPKYSFKSGIISTLKEK